MVTQTDRPQSGRSQVGRMQGQRVQSVLPSRFPVGTRFVIEGRGGRIHLQYLEFPDGRQIEVPARATWADARRKGRSRMLRQKATARKI